MSERLPPRAHVMHGGQETVQSGGKRQRHHQFDLADTGRAHRAAASGQRCPGVNRVCRRWALEFTLIEGHASRVGPSYPQRGTSCLIPPSIWVVT